MEEKKTRAKRKKEGVLIYRISTLEQGVWRDWTGFLPSPPYTIDSIILHKICFEPFYKNPKMKFAIFLQGSGFVQEIEDKIPGRRKLSKSRIERFLTNHTDRFRLSRQIQYESEKLIDELYDK